MPLTSKFPLYLTILEEVQKKPMSMRDLTDLIVDTTGVTRKSARDAIEMFVERGYGHLNLDMHIELGSGYP